MVKFTPFQGVSLEDDAPLLSGRNMHER